MKQKSFYPKIGLNLFIKLDWLHGILLSCSQLFPFQYFQILERQEKCLISYLLSLEQQFWGPFIYILKLLETKMSHTYIHIYIFGVDPSLKEHSIQNLVKKGAVGPFWLMGWIPLLKTRFDYYLRIPSPLVHNILVN